ncbi:UPF0481 protein At3g47200-like [Diospyros lotus]|uniref:UPF0481 protein At3g47200-like n=1 Tax=Diospyros lotus TaxID=55363 RepID=UPI002256F281|nr:UPF0481 protein At3g47200-like [Diospyros lotus]
MATDTECLTDIIFEQISQPPEFSPQRTIYRVPDDLRKLKESAYTPQFVSIGPLHSRDKHLDNSRVNKTKVKCVGPLIYRAAKSKKQAREIVQKCLTAMEESIGEAQNYYPKEKPVTLNREMLFLDGSFILELLYRHYDVVVLQKKKVDQIPELGIDSAVTYRTVQRDLLLLENQLPFSVLDTLFHLLTESQTGTQKGPSLIEYVLLFFHDLLRLQSIPAKVDGDTFHILHLLHKHYLPADLPPAMTSGQFMQSATDLDHAGVKFESHNAKSQLQLHNAGISPFQVEFQDPCGVKRWWFSRACFKIPTLHIDDSTELFLRNLIAFEQCCPLITRYVTSYAFVMDRLINTAKDVDVLQKAGIVCNYLGSHKDASELFNKLCSEVAIGDFYFSQTCEKADKYSRRCWPQAVAHLRRNNFATPWAYIAFCVAFLVFFSSLTTVIRNLRYIFHL